MDKRASEGCNKWLQNSLQSLKLRTQQKLGKEHDHSAGNTSFTQLFHELRSGTFQEAGLRLTDPELKLGDNSQPLSAVLPTLLELEKAWLTGRLSYTDTVYGLWLTERLLDSLEPTRSSAGLERRPQWGNILLAAAPSSQHIFGLSVVAERFGGAGWKTTTLIDGNPATILQTVQTAWVDVIGLSIGHDEGLVDLDHLTSVLRQECSNPEVKIIIGGNIFSSPTNQYDWLGADFVAINVEDALGYCSAATIKQSLRH